MNGAGPRHTQDPLRFKLERLNEIGWGHFRGIRVLNDVLKNEAMARRIWSVSVIPGHIAITLDQGRLLWLLDSVPANARLEEHQEEILMKDIQGTLEAGGDISNLLLQRYPAKISFLWFNKGSCLELLLVLENGFVVVWDWLEQKMIWKLRGKVCLSLETRPTILLAAYLPSNNKEDGENIMWIEKHNSWNENDRTPSVESTLFLGQYKIDPDQRVIPNGSSFELEQIKEAIEECYQGNGGLWMLTKKKNLLFFWDAQTRVLYSSTLSTIPGLENSIVVMSKSHPITLEPVLLTNSGQIVVCRFTPSEGIKVVIVSTLSPWDSDGSNVIDIDILHHLLVLYFPEEAKIFEIRSGAFVGIGELPFRLNDPKVASPNFTWKPSTKGDNLVGIWSFSGLYCLMSRSISDIALRIVENNPANFKHAARLCQDWGLQRWQARYLIDAVQYAQQQGSYKGVLEASLKLLPHLQNPSLVLALLAQTNLIPKFIIEELEKFVKKIGPLDHSKLNRVASRELSRQSFQFYTPLNLTVLPSLNSYLEMQSGKPSNLKMYDKNVIVASITEKQILQLSPTKLEMSIESHPKVIFEKLRNALGISDDFLSGLSASYEWDPPESAANFPPINAQIFHAEECLPGAMNVAGVRQSDTVQYFEVLVRLYYKEKPNLLVSFVDLVELHYAECRPSSTSRRSYYSRALDVLPPIEDPMSTQFEARVGVRVLLLDRIGENTQALRLLLSLGKNYWEKSLSFVRNKIKRKIDHGPLFHMLVTHSLKASSQPSFLYAYQQSPTPFAPSVSVSESYKLTELWKMIPPNFKSLDLLALVGYCVKTDPDLTKDKKQDYKIGNTLGLLCDEGQYPLMVLKDPLLMLLKKEIN